MAKTKLCCSPDGCGEIIETNYGVDEQAWMTERRCAGSKCMVWKTQNPVTAAEMASNKHPGYCGLTR